jgi:hypothetical protein
MKRAPPSMRRSGLMKLGAARARYVGRGGPQPRQRRGGPALPAGSCPEARHDGVREKPGWPSLGAATATLLAMQTKLHQWSRADANRRFDDLHNLVHEPAFLVAAWDQVAHNTGARTAGLDGRSPRSIAEPKSSWLSCEPGSKLGSLCRHGCGSTPSFAAIDLVAVGPGHQASLAELLAFLAGQAIVATAGVGVLLAGPGTQGLGGDAEILGL